MLKTWVWFLGQEDPLEKAMATHSNIPAWEIPWTEEPGGLQSVGKQESDITEQLNNNSNIRGLHTLEGQSNEKCVCDKVCSQCIFKYLHFQPPTQSSSHLKFILIHISSITPKYVSYRNCPSSCVFNVRQTFAYSFHLLTHYARTNHYWKTQITLQSHVFPRCA